MPPVVATSTRSPASANTVARLTTASDRDGSSLGDVIRMAKRWRRGLTRSVVPTGHRVAPLGDGTVDRGAGHGGSGSAGAETKGRAGASSAGSRPDPPRLTHVTAGAVRIATYSLRYASEIGEYGSTTMSTTGIAEVEFDPTGISETHGQAEDLLGPLGGA